MKVSAQYAEEHFAELASAAKSGEEVEVAYPGSISLKLVVSTAPAAGKSSGRRVLGAGRGELRVPSEAEWKTMDKELESQMNDAPLFPAKHA